MAQWKVVTTCLTHWGRVTHIYVSQPTSIGSDNGLSPGRRQAIIWTNAGMLLIGPLGTNFSEILIEIQTFSLRKMRLEMSSAKRQPFCLGLNVLMLHLLDIYMLKCILHHFSSLMQVVVLLENKNLSVNTMTAAALGMQGSRASAVLVNCPSLHGIFDYVHGKG